MRKIALKKAQVDLDKDKLELGRTRVEVKEKHAQLQRDKIEAKENQKKEKLDNRDNNLNMAAKVAERLSKYVGIPANRTKIAKTVERLVKNNQVTKGRIATAPQFFETVPSLSRNIAVRRHGKVSPQWASAAFTFWIFDGKTQHSAKDPEPLTNYFKLLDRTVPGYNAILPFELRSSQLLLKHGGLFDKAYLEAVWWYTRTLGHKSYPGLHQPQMRTTPAASTHPVAVAVAPSLPQSKKAKTDG